MRTILTIVGGLTVARYVYKQLERRRVLENHNEYLTRRVTELEAKLNEKGEE